MSGRAKVAVLGCGYWGRNLVRNFHQLGALARVCDPAPGGRQAAAEIAPGVAVSASFQEAFDDPAVAAVVLATPAETHAPLAEAAMAKGKDVFVEKPLALSHAEGLRIRDAAERTGRIVMVGHLLEYHPAVLKLRELLASGELGKLGYLYSNRLNFGKVRTAENALWSFAPHDIAVLLRLVGESPIEVTSVGGSYLTPNLADVTVSCLHFRSGVRAHIFVSWLNPFKEQKLVVVGDRRMAVFNDVSKDEKLVLFDQRVEFEKGQPVLQKNDATVIGLAADEPLRRECEHFLECVEARRAPLSDVRSGLEVVRVLQACQVSLQLNGRPTALSDI